MTRALQNGLAVNILSNLKSIGKVDVVPVSNGGTGATSLTEARDVLGIGNKVKSLTSAYTITSEDRGKTLSGTGTWNLTLGDPVTLGNGFKINIRNAGGGTLSVVPPAGVSLDGSSTSYSLAAGETVELVCTGNSFYTVSNYTSVGGGSLGIGTILKAGSRPSNSWLECNGSVYLKSQYSDLAQKLGSIPDGNSGSAITWTKKSTVHKATNGYDALAFGNGIFVYIEFNSIGVAVHTSSDKGATWIDRQTLTGGNSYVSLIYTGSIFMIATTNTTVASRNTSVYTSTDGITWNKTADIPRLGGCALASNDNGTSVLAIRDSTAGYLYTYTSMDNGITWEQASSPLGVASGPDISAVYGGGIFLLYFTTDSSSTVRLFRSSDGKDWSSVQVPGNTNVTHMSFTYTEGVFIAIPQWGASNTPIYKSVDMGVTWTLVYTANTGGGCSAISASNVIVVWIGKGYSNDPGLTVYVSLDKGNTWSEDITESTLFGLPLVALGSGVFMVIGQHPSTDTPSTVLTAPTGSLYSYDPETEFITPKITAEQHLESYILAVL